MGVAWFEGESGHFRFYGKTTIFSNRITNHEFHLHRKGPYRGNIS